MPDPPIVPPALPDPLRAKGLIDDRIQITCTECVSVGSPIQVWVPVLQLYRCVACGATRSQAQIEPILQQVRNNILGRRAEQDRVRGRPQ